MYIKSIRYGFANNSSSSHSIVFLGDFQVKNTAYSGEGFGWEFFTASNEQSKKEYCFATLLSAGNIASYIPKTPLTEKVGWLNPYNYSDVMKKYKMTHYEEIEKTVHKDNIDFAKKLTNNLKWEALLNEFSDIFGKELIEKWKNIDEGENSWDLPSVDHQSILSLPTDHDGTIHIGFAKEFFRILITKNFAFLGGNDNSEDSHELIDKDTYSEDPQVQAVQTVLDIIGTESKGPLCVYDELNDDYVIQNSRNGNKVRISFNSKKDTKKSIFPELVDLKITGYCEYGCKFCYQSSTKEGKHASLENIKNIIKSLANSGVMEIAMGGGEPTTHPDLLEILKEIKKHKMLACFTTKNFDLHTRPDFKEVIETTNSIAFSCNSIAEIEKVIIIRNAIYEVAGYENNLEIYIQMIPELMTDLNFEKALNLIGKKLYTTPVTLLGYKDFGFGEKYSPKNRFASSDWIKTVKEHSGKRGIKFGIDSVLVSKWKKELIENHVDPLALVGEEGKFSCYVDAVTMSIHKSSFSKDVGILITGQEENIKEQFKIF